MGPINVNYWRGETLGLLELKKTKRKPYTILESGQNLIDLRAVDKQKLQHIGSSASGKNEGYGAEPESKAIERIKFYSLSRFINESLRVIHKDPLPKCLIRERERIISITLKAGVIENSKLWDMDHTEIVQPGAAQRKFLSRI